MGCCARPATNCRASSRPHVSTVGIALRAALLLLAVARSAQPANAWGSRRSAAGRQSVKHIEWNPHAATRTAARALHFASFAARESELCCLEVELLSPYLPLGKAPPAPTTRFDAARARAVRCLALSDCAGQPTSLVPTAEVQPSSGGSNGSEAPFSMTMRLAVPAAGAFTPAWPGKDAAREPPAAVLVPAGTWTHFAGDSLLRGVFSTLTQDAVRAWVGTNGVGCCNG